MEIDFSRVKTLCVVGLSNNSSRPAYRIAKNLLREGLRIIPVNPRQESVFGEKGYSSIAEIPADIEIDLANFFLREEKVLMPVREALVRGIKIIWLQQGIVNHEAARLAESYGARMIMDECFYIKYMEQKYSHLMGRGGLDEL